VEHEFGKGKALLVGSFPGGGYYLHHSASGKSFFAGLLRWANSEPCLRTDAAGAQARLHMGAGGSYLYVVNPDRAPRKVMVTLASTYGPFETGEDVWGSRKVTVKSRSVEVEVADRDVAVIHLK
jgi:beta-galactosidase